MALTAEHKEAMKVGRERARAARAAMPRPSMDTEVFIAQHSNDARTVVEDVPLSDGERQAFNESSAQATELQVSRTVEKTAPGTVVMYRPTGTWGFVPVFISTNAIRQVLQVGWLPQCGDCHRQGCGVNADGTLTSDPNKCPGKANVQYDRCPICGKPVFDLVEGGGRGVEDDPNRLLVSAFANLTPEMRIKARIEQHMMWTHETAARAYGLVRPAVPTTPTGAL